MMLRARSHGPLVACTILLGLAVACGTEGDSTFDPGNASGDDSGASSSGSSGELGSSTSSSSSGGSSGVSDLDGSACASQTAIADRAPAYLYFVFDKSGSMGDGTHGNPAQKWNPVTTAFKGFLGSTNAAGITAALTMFPDTTTDHCAVTSYTTPDVALTALPEVAPFTTALGTTETLGTTTHGTPTLPALRGVLPAAKANALAHPEAKTVVVLVTDGEPMGCAGSGIPSDDRNSLTNIGIEVAKYKDIVPTYVIGVGKSLTSLDGIAAKGGTTDAILIDVGDPAKTEAEFASTIDKIRLKALSCEVAIPKAPADQTLDYAKVNVAYTPASGTKEALAYDEACGAGGWHFDNATKPEKIVLCPTLCDKAKADPKSVVGVEFGCARRETGPK